MKSLITPNLIKFTLVTLILTILFRLTLSTTITNMFTVGIILSAIIYAISMWINGSYFGKKEYEYLPIYDIGFRFHFATFIAHNGISILWFVFGFQSHYETINTIFITAAIWSVFLVIHFFYFLSVRKSSIKNLDRDDLFE